MRPVVGAVPRSQQEEFGGALAAQRRLIEAARAPGGARTVLAELAAVLDCWALLLDETGAARHSVPPQARRHAAPLRLDLDRLAAADAGGGGTVQAASLDLGDDQVAVLPVVGGLDGVTLAVGRPTPLNRAEHTLLAGAAGLLALDAAHRHRLRQERRQARLAVLRLAAAGHTSLAETTAGTLGYSLPPAPLRIAVLGGAPEDAPDLLRAAEEDLALQQAGALVAQWDRTTVVVLLPVAEGETRALEELLHRVPGSRGVVSDGTALPEVPDALRRARSVFFGTVGEVGRLVLARDVATAGLLAQLDNPGGHGWAEALLEPLERHTARSKLDLISTLRVFLARNGMIDASATELGIHRHTLRYRLDRITALLDTDLDDPTVRAELWLALRLRDGR